MNPASSAINSGDTAWVLTSAALVMLMTPGLALFYGGLVRRKNVLSTIMHSIFILALVSVTWVLFGFTLAFGKDVNGWGIIGGLDYIGLRGVGKDPLTQYAPNIPGYRLHGLPDDVRRHHAGPHHRRLRRTQALQGLRAVLAAVDAPRVLADRPLGLGRRRLAPQAGRPRLRRRHRRPHQLGRRGPGRRPRPGTPGQARVGPLRAARRPPDGHRRRPALVRLVRLQRRLRPGGQRHCRQRVRRHEHGGGHGRPHLGHR